MHIDFRTILLILVCQSMAADDVTRREHVMVPMRDGTRLSTFLYFPEGKGPWPVLYEQRYMDIGTEAAKGAYARLASGGYVVAAQNFRGAYLSEGAFNGYRALGWGEYRDGYDTVEWLAGQPWSTGKIGSFGGSQAGYAQNFLAVTQPRHLTAQYMTDTGLSLFHEGYRIGGTTRPNRFSQFTSYCRDPEDGRRWVATMFEHPVYDNYWAQEDCTRHFDKMNVPCFTLGSWFDFMSVGSIQSFIGRQHHGGANSRARQQLLIGPWLHGGVSKATTKIGDLDFPENAKFDIETHMIRWFDHYLKGVENGVEREPAVRYYVLGAVGEADAPGNAWRSATDWPVPVSDTAYYLSDKGLSMTAPTANQGATTFRSDPMHPAPIPGLQFPGARDAREYEKHPDVRTFTTARLEYPVEWTGKIRAELFVSSTARDTDFITRITDVYPDGRSILIVDSVRRARFREGFDREVLMEPGKIYKVAFDLGSTSLIFNRGHRIRVTIASTGAPFYEPNPNTGGPMTLEPPKAVIPAQNTVYHNRRYGSRVVAPSR
jgi:predicted acyl esterase